MAFPSSSNSTITFISPPKRLYQPTSKLKPTIMKFHCLFLTLLIAGFTIRNANAEIAESNSVVGEPFITCGADAIYAKWRTNKTFTGHVNVRYAPNKFCYQVLVTNNQIELLVPHQDCLVNRIRSLTPPGLILETSVLISFHPQFVTTGDRVYLLKCLHAKPKKHNSNTVTTATLTLPKGVPFDGNLTDASDWAPSNESETSNLRCQYRITDSIAGGPIDSAEVGAEVDHSWQCENVPAGQCLVVTNCLLKTFDSQYEIIDNNGCSKDKRVMPELKYLNESSVSARVRIFGVAQRPNIHFQCQLNLLPHDPRGQCYRPSCSRSRRDVVNYLLSEATESFDAMSPEIEVIQPGVRKSPSKKPSEGGPDCATPTRIENIIPIDMVCVNKTSFTLVTVATLLIAVITLGVVLYIILRRYYPYTDVPSTE
uniref:ZP domain-containing protein n=1 Tax=Panagrellus redivivus TaxID=6233 RepID=A0A7E5A225_PANRE